MKLLVLLLTFTLVNNFTFAQSSIEASAKKRDLCIANLIAQEIAARNYSGIQVTDVSRIKWGDNFEFEALDLKSNTEYNGIIRVEITKTSEGFKCSINTQNVFKSHPMGTCYACIYDSFKLEANGEILIQETYEFHNSHFL